MAIYHLYTKPVSRSKGRSAVAAAAYRSGCGLYDERTGLTFDYTHKQGIIHSEIVTPDGQAADRNQLWNVVEAAEKRKDARTARKWRAALPAELNKAQQIELVKSFSPELASRYGVAADFAIHEPDKHGDDRNFHAHILITTRTAQLDERGNVQLGEKATIELCDKDHRKMGLGAAKDEVTAIRQLWEQQTIVKEALQRTKQNYKLHLEHTARIEKILQEKRLNEAREIEEKEGQNSHNSDITRKRQRGYNMDR